VIAECGGLWALPIKKETVEAIRKAAEGKSNKTNMNRGTINDANDTCIVFRYSVTYTMEILITVTDLFDTQESSDDEEGESITTWEWEDGTFREDKPPSDSHVDEEFDSTLGYPGEGPPEAFIARVKEVFPEECDDVKTCPHQRCTITGHMHRNVAYKGKEKRQAEERKNRKKGKNSKGWKLCEMRVIAKNCVEEHGHCPGQNYISDIHQEYLNQGQEGYEAPLAPVDLGQFQFIPDVPADEDDIDQVQEAWDLPLDRMPPISDSEDSDIPDLEDDSGDDEPEPHRENKHQKKKKKKMRKGGKKKSKKTVKPVDVPQQPIPALPLPDVKHQVSTPGANYEIPDFDGVASPGPVPQKSKDNNKPQDSQSAVRDSWAKKYPKHETEELKAVVSQSKHDGMDVLRQFMKDVNISFTLIQGLYEYNQSHADVDEKTGKLARRITSDCDFVKMWKSTNHIVTWQEKADLLSNDLYKLEAMAKPIPLVPTSVPEWDEILPDFDEEGSDVEDDKDEKGEPDLVLPGLDSPPPAAQPGAIPQPAAPLTPQELNSITLTKLCALCLTHLPETSFSKQQWEQEKRQCHQCTQPPSVEHKGEGKEHKQPSAATIADQKRQIVEAMYPKIKTFCPTKHSKVAGMIYELPMKELLKLDSHQAVEAKCKEALQVLQQPPAEQWGDTSEEEDEEEEKEDEDETKRAEVAAFMADMLTVRTRTIYFSRLPSTLLGRVGAKFNTALKSAVHIKELIKRRADTGEDAALIANRGVVYGLEECVVSTVQDPSEVSRLLREYSAGRTGLSLTLSNSLDTNNINIIDELGLNRKISTAVYSEVAAKIIADRKVNLANNISNSGKVTTQLKTRIKYAIGLLVDPAGDPIESRLIEFDKYIYDCTICYIINTLLFADYFVNLTNPAARTPFVKTVFQDLAATLMPLSIVASTALKGSLL